MFSSGTPCSETPCVMECHNDQSFLSDGLQSTQCMTISYNNCCRLMKNLFKLSAQIFSTVNISIMQQSHLNLSATQLCKEINSFTSCYNLYFKSTIEHLPWQIIFQICYHVSGEGVYCPFNAGPLLL